MYAGANRFFFPPFHFILVNVSSPALIPMPKVCGLKRIRISLANGENRGGVNRKG